MSKIEVDKIDPQSGTALEVGTSGDTVTVPSGVTLTTTNATVNLPASVGGLGTGITNAQLAGSIDVTSKITGVVPTANLGSGAASSAVFLSGASTWIAAGGGMWEKISNQTISNAATVDFTTFSSDYQDFKLIGSGLHPVTDNVNLALRLSIASSFITADYAFGNMGYDDDDNIKYSSGNSQSYIRCNVTNLLAGNAATEGTDFELTMYHVHSTALWTNVGIISQVRTDNSRMQPSYGGASLNNT